MKNLTANRDVYLDRRAAEAAEAPQSGGAPWAPDCRSAAGVRSPGGAELALAERLLAGAGAELARLRVIRGTHQRTARRMRRALATLALATGLLGTAAVVPAAAATPQFESTVLIPNVGTFEADPNLADIDGDGDLDAFIGMGNGNTYLFPNTGTPSTPAFAPATATPFGITRVGFGSLSLDATLLVDRAGQLCGTKDCWKPIGPPPPDGKGYVYKDKDHSSDGVGLVKLKAGDPGRTTLLVKGKNNSSKGQTSLPTGLTTALAGNQVTMQLRTSDAECFSVTLNDVTAVPGKLTAK